MGFLHSPQHRSHPKWEQYIEQGSVQAGFNLLADKILNLNAWKIAVDNLILRKKHYVLPPESGKVQAISF